MERILAPIVGVVLVGVVAAALLGLGLTVLAQGEAGSGCDGCGLAASGACGENATVVTVTGMVAETGLDQETAWLTLDAGEQGMVRVEMGPPAYAETVGFTARAGDRLAVTGHYAADGVTLVAHAVGDEGSGQVFAFCDEAGHPLWADEDCEH